MIDDFLDLEDFAKVWKYVQAESYVQPMSAGSWLKVWRLGDNQPLGSNAYHSTTLPHNNMMDLINEKFVEIAGQYKDIVSEYKELILRSYIYARGCKLSWHDDSTVYAGAATYYTHPKWGSTWGGELMIAEAPSIEEVFKQKPSGPHLEHEWEDRYINIYGLGQWISPKPNRLVLMAPGVYHSINRVDPDAGDHCRCGIVGFFKV